MFKLYKNLRAKDWFLIIFLTGLTVLQVYFTMTLVDQVQAIIEAITYLDYHNHPEKLGEAFSAFISAVGWGGVTSDSLAAIGISGEAAERFLKMDLEMRRTHALLRAFIRAYANGRRLYRVLRRFVFNDDDKIKSIRQNQRVFRARNQRVFRGFAYNESN